MKPVMTVIFLLNAIIFSSSINAQEYLWNVEFDSTRTIKNIIVPPAGYERIEAAPGSLAEWLRNLPLKEKDTPVYLYDGRKKSNQEAHWEVVDIDVGDKNLQQCADAIIRLRAEYLYAKGLYDSISFDFTSGDAIPFRKWIEGIRPEVSGDRVRWINTDEIDSSYANFREYLNVIFTYAGSYSLSKQLKPRTDICNIEIGDIFIEGGFPGHAVIVVDVVVNKSSGKRKFLLAQSYMPAQDIHILKCPYKHPSSPWYNCDIGEKLITPEWIFDKKDLKKF